MRRLAGIRLGVLSAVAAATLFAGVGTAAAQTPARTTSVQALETLLGSTTGAPMLSSLLTRPRTVWGSARAALATYADPIGDAEAGAAPDLSLVVIDNDTSGTIGVGVGYANRNCAGPGDFVAVFFDVDQNPATGSSPPNGTEYAVYIDGTSNLAGLARWNGMTFEPVPATSLRVGCSPSARADVITISRLELGVTSGFTFYVASLYSSAGVSYHDSAPDALPNWNYQLAAAPPPTPPTPTPPPAPPTPPPSPPAPAPVEKTYESADALPSSQTFDGSRSIKHTGLGSLVYRTMKRAASPRLLAVACWSNTDYDSVAASVGISIESDDFEVSGFWLGRQPRWLHLAPWICDAVQPLLDTRRPNGRRAGALAVVFHEALHAYGIRNEALANCYAVQLVPFAGRNLGMTASRADYLRKLALNFIRRTAPPDYWDASRCRDGGAWDMLPRVANLR